MHWVVCTQHRRSRASAPQNLYFRFVTTVKAKRWFRHARRSAQTTACFCVDIGQIALLYWFSCESGWYENETIGRSASGANGFFRTFRRNEIVCHLFRWFLFFAHKPKIRWTTRHLNGHWASFYLRAFVSSAQCGPAAVCWMPSLSRSYQTTQFQCGQFCHSQ